MNVKRKKINGVPVCMDCERKTKRWHSGAPHPVRCEPCRIKRQNLIAASRGGAHSRVQAALRSGLIRPASEFQCVDCRVKQAECYDHRDYNRPLDVDPVCRSCNCRRGHAVFVAPKLLQAIAQRAA